MRLLSLSLVLAVGCGLLIDVDPPPEERDASTERDAGPDPDAGADAPQPNDADIPTEDGDVPPADANEFDAGAPDAGPACVTNTDCEDGTEVGPCQVRGCGRDGVCKIDLKPAGGTCDDGDPCTHRDACGADGACGGQPVDCSDRSTLCSVGLCSADEGMCVSEPLPPGTTCSPALNLTGYCGPEGRCQGLECDEGFANCRGGLDDGCETPLGTPDNCGGCGIRCDDGPVGSVASCVTGRCIYECDGGLTPCLGSAGTSLVCVNTNTDPLHCGRCMYQCDGSARLCNMGVCVVSPE